MELTFAQGIQVSFYSTVHCAEDVSLRIVAPVSMARLRAALLVCLAWCGPVAAVNVVDLSVGKNHSCALTSAGGVKCWGFNVNGPLGDGNSSGYSSTPVDVVGLGSGVAAITTGIIHSCALTNAGAVFCWGGNGSGQLGDGTTSNSPVPVAVADPGLSAGAKAVAGNGLHTCAITAAGAVKCWGSNVDGGLGDGTGMLRTTPVAAADPGLAAGVKALSIGQAASHGCAVTAAGAVRCWGPNSAGQVGDGTLINRPVAVAVADPDLASGVKAVAVGNEHSCALTAAGAVKCWGDNGDGQLGDGSTTPQPAPVAVAGLGSGVTAIAASVRRTCAVASGGLKCWGDLPWEPAPVLAPTDVAGLTSGIKAVSLGDFFSCVVTTAGAVKCWGDNAWGKLGDGTTVSTDTPVNVVGFGGGNTAPVFTGVPSIVGTPVVGGVLHANDTSTSDADGDPVALAYQWYRDGVPIAGATAMSYTLESSDHHATITLGITASDGTDHTVAMTLGVKVRYEGPDTRRDEYSTPEGRPLSVQAPGVLGNDIDESGGSLTAVLVGGPEHGTVALQAEGGFHYAPASGFIGMDHFSYKACAPSGECRTESVAINVWWQNKVPVAQDDRYWIEVDGELLLPAPGVLANDIDVEGDRLGAVVASYGGSGRLRLLADGGLHYIPAAGFEGEDRIVYRACDIAGECGQAVIRIGVRGHASRADRMVWTLPSTNNARQQGVLRLINREGRSGHVSISGYDETGQRSTGVLTLDLAAGEARQINSQDLEHGNPGLGLEGGIGKGGGDYWTLAVSSELELDVLSYFRTAEGFFGTAHDTVVGDAMEVDVPVFNPAENHGRRSKLRLVNTSATPAYVRIRGVDDAGYPGADEVRVTLGGLEAVELDAAEIEQGDLVEGVSGGLGDGYGKWRLSVAADVPVQVVSLLVDGNGNMANLSTRPMQRPGSRWLWTVPAADQAVQSFIRVSNRSSQGGRVTVRGVDASGHRSEGVLSFILDANASLQFNAQDLEGGNPTKGLAGSIGPGSGNWVLAVESDLDIDVLAYARMPEDGFFAALHDVVRDEDGQWNVPVFNPASNLAQQSWLRLVNPGDQPIDVSIRGTDDAGRPAPDGEVLLRLAPRAAIELSSQDLELGNSVSGMKGRLGDGSGKWRLSVQASGDLRVVNLLRNPQGYLVNLSSAARPESL